MHPWLDHIGIATVSWMYHGGEILMNLAWEGVRDNAGLWRPLGGVVEYGETIERALFREMEEESGIPESMIAETTLLGYQEKIGDGAHWILFFYAMRVRERWHERITEPDKVVDMRWMTLDEILALPDLHTNLPVALSLHGAKLRALVESS